MLPYRAIFNLLVGCACLLGFMLFRWLGVQFYESRIVSLHRPTKHTITIPSVACVEQTYNQLALLCLLVGSAAGSASFCDSKELSEHAPVMQKLPEVLVKPPLMNVRFPWNIW